MLGACTGRSTFPANMYIWDPYGQNLGIYPIRVLHGLFCLYKTYIGPILVNFDQQTRTYGNHMGRFGAFIPLGPTWAPYRLFCPYKTLIGPILVKFDN